MGLFDDVKGVKMGSSHMSKGTCAVKIENITCDLDSDPAVITFRYRVKSTRDGKYLNKVLWQNTRMDPGSVAKAALNSTLLKFDCDLDSLNSVKELYDMLVAKLMDKDVEVFVNPKQDDNGKWYENAYLNGPINESADYMNETESTDEPQDFGPEPSFDTNEEIPF